MPEPWLNEEQTWLGRWWIPSSPDNTQPGTLHYAPTTGLELRLIGGFDDTVRKEVAPGMFAVSLSDARLPVLHGSSSGKSITLLDCLVTQSSSHSSTGFDGPSEQTLVAQQAIVGVHISSADEPVFTAADCLIEDSLVWAGTSGIVARIKTDKTIEGPLGSIELLEVESLHATTGALDIELFHEMVLPHIEPTRRGVTTLVRDSVIFRITPREPFSVRGAFEAMRSMQDLISLASGRAAAFLWTKARLTNSDSMPFRREVAFYGRARGSGDPQARARDWNGFVFTLDDVAFADLMPRWSEVQGKFLASCNIILGSRFQATVYLETFIINSVTAAEAFHKALDEPWPIPKEELTALIELAVEAMPEERKEWMRRFVPGGHSLRQRLESLARRIPDAARSKLVPNPAAWAQAATKARNGLSHSGQSAGEAEALYAVGVVTQAVVTVNLLLELGLGEERIARALTQNNELRHACQLAADHFGPDRDPEITDN